MNGMDTGLRQSILRLFVVLQILLVPWVWPVAVRADTIPTIGQSQMNFPWRVIGGTEFPWRDRRGDLVWTLSAQFVATLNGQQVGGVTCQA